MPTVSRPPRTRAASDGARSLSPLELKVTTANYAARRIREVMADGTAKPAPKGWGRPIGRANGGLPSRWAVPPPSVNPEPSREIWVTGIWPEALTSKSERAALEEL